MERYIAEIMLEQVEKGREFLIGSQVEAFERIKKQWKELGALTKLQEEYLEKLWSQVP